MIADLTKFFGWPPESAWRLTGSEIRWWVAQANRIVEARAES